MICLNFCMKQMIKKKNTKLVSVIKSGSKDLKEEIERMSEDEKKN